MKLTTLAFLYLSSATSASAFSVTSMVVLTRHRIEKNTCLQGTLRPDSSEVVAEALRISKEFGAASKEAQVAWEIVEEMDSNFTPMNNVVATSSTSASNALEHEIDYKLHVRALSSLLQETKEKINEIKVLASNVQQMELNDPHIAKLPDDATGLKNALQEAKAAAEVHGPNSREAIDAWEAAQACMDRVNGEECSVETTHRYSAAAIKAHHYYDAVVDREFLQEAIDAVDTISALRRFVSVENSRLSGGFVP
jgi:hypothetical protein